MEVTYQSGEPWATIYSPVRATNDMLLKQVRYFSDGIYSLDTQFGEDTWLIHWRSVLSLPVLKRIQQQKPQAE